LPTAVADWTLRAKRCIMLLNLALCGWPEVAKINEYLTIGEAAEFLGVSRDTLRRWDRSGNLKARRHPVSRYRLYVKQDLEQFLLRLREDEVGERSERTGSAGRGRPGWE
jgi:excisionase family DNA binding protein